MGKLLSFRHKPTKWEKDQHVMETGRSREISGTMLTVIISTILWVVILVPLALAVDAGLRRFGTLF